MKKPKLSRAFRLPVDMVFDLQHASEQSGISQTELVVCALAQYLSRFSGPLARLAIAEESAESNMRTTRRLSAYTVIRAS